MSENNKQPDENKNYGSQKNNLLRVFGVLIGTVMSLFVLFHVAENSYYISEVGVECACFFILLAALGSIINILSQ